MLMSKISRKDELLSAAASVVLERGGAALTLDAVVEASGLSKGGVLYHFHTKEALILGLIEKEIAAFEEDLARRLAAEPEPRAAGAYARAYIDATLGAKGGPSVVLGGLVAAIASDASLLEPYRARTKAWRSRMAADGLDRGLAEAVRLAVDGYYYSAAIGAAAPAGRDLAALRSTLLEMTRGGRA
jgi:AcrR family transcriptional regulator